MTTAPSTIMPKSIAPRLIRLALIPKSRMPRKPDEHGERDNGGGDGDDAAQVPEAEQQHDGHEHETLEKVFLNGVYGAFDDERLVIERNNFDSRRKPEARDSFLHELDQLLLLPPFSMMTKAGDRFAVAQCGAFGRPGSDVNVGHVAQSSGTPSFALRTMLPEVRRGATASSTDQRILLGGVLDVSTAEVGVVRFHACRDIMQREAELVEQRGVDHDLELLCLAAPRIDFAHTGEGAELGLDHPFVKVPSGPWGLAWGRRVY